MIKKIIDLLRLPFTISNKLQTINNNIEVLINNQYSYDIRLKDLNSKLLNLKMYMDNEKMYRSQIEYLLSKIPNTEDKEIKEFLNHLHTIRR